MIYSGYKYDMLETLEKLFGSAARVKIMRLFLFNPSITFDLEQVRDRSKVSASTARAEVAMMEKTGLLKKKSFFKEKVRGKGKNKKAARTRTVGWTTNDGFEYLEPLQRLLIHVSPLRDGEILKRLSRIGKLKLVVVAGFFIQNLDSRIDLLIVGDNIKKTALENIIKTIESEIGREIRYAWFSTQDFQYRLSMYDKLIRDVLDFPHEKILDKLQVVKEADSFE